MFFTKKNDYNACFINNKEVIVETVSTIIEFVESVNPSENISATGDFLGMTLLIVAIAIAASAAILKLRKKSLASGGVFSSLANKWKTYLIAAVAVVLLALGLVFSVNRASADGTNIAQASEKVYALVDTETGEVTFENGYIKSNVPADVNSVGVKVDLLDSAELTYNFNWQIKIGDEVIYNGVAQDLKHDFYIDVKDAQTSFEITNLSTTDAKALIGKEVVKVSFWATTLQKVQSDAYFQIYDVAVPSLDTIAAIPATSLLDEDRAEANAKISKILEDCLEDISSTEDPAELQEIVDGFNSQIETYTNEAKQIAEQTAAEKKDFIDEKTAKAQALRTNVDDNDLLTDEDKEEFLSQIDVLEKQDIPYINSITTRTELDLQEADINSRLEALDDSIAARIEQRFVEYKENALSNVGKMKDDGVVSINEIDNLSEGKKNEYNKIINEASEETLVAVKAAAKKEVIDSEVESLSVIISNLIAEAEAIAYRPWVLDTWNPASNPSVIRPNDNYIFDEIATVSDDDPYKDYAPAPTYYIKDAAEHENYFTIQTTGDSKAQIIVNSSTPKGEYYLTIYATFDSVTDLGYKTNTNEVNVTISVWSPQPVAAPSEEEIVLGDYEDDPLYTDGFNTFGYVLSDGGTELKANNAKAGDTLNLYLYKIPTTPSDQYWMVELWGGHWGENWFKNICQIGYPGAAEEGRTEYDLEANNGIYSVELTQEMLDKAYEQQGWGGSFVLCGDNIACARVTLTHAPYEETLWEGEMDIPGWDGYGLFSDGGSELTSKDAHAGQYLNFELTDLSDNDSWCFQIREGHWIETSIYGEIRGENSGQTAYTIYNLSEHNGVYSLLLTQDILNEVCTSQGWGNAFLLCGLSVRLTKVTLSDNPY